MSSSLTWTVQQTVAVADNTSGNLAGHNLLMTITVASGISNKPFVFQRAPVTPGATDFEDAFYSVASVNDLADLTEDAPAVDSVFYRTSSINLFFSNLDDLSAAIVDIEALLGSLCRANDLANTLASPATHHYP